jgi:very-short-patch-repair endonuclease
MLHTVWSGRLPHPVVQHPVSCNGRTLWLDFAYPDIRLGIEGDGYGTHGLREAFERDRRRDADLIALGWMVLRFTWKQVRNESDWVVDRISKAHELRTAQFFGH